MQPSTRGSYFLLGSILPRSGRASHVDDLHAGYSPAWWAPGVPPDTLGLHVVCLGRSGQMAELTSHTQAV